MIPVHSCNILVVLEILDLLFTFLHCFIWLTLLEKMVDAEVIEFSRSFLTDEIFPTTEFPYEAIVAYKRMGLNFHSFFFLIKLSITIGLIYLLLVCYKILWKVTDLLRCFNFFDKI